MFYANLHVRMISEGLCDWGQE